VAFLSEKPAGSPPSLKREMSSVGGGLGFGGLGGETDFGSDLGSLLSVADVMGSSADCEYYLCRCLEPPAPVLRARNPLRKLQPFHMSRHLRASAPCQRGLPVHTWLVVCHCIERRLACAGFGVL
jgi:hypothetical protein